MIKPNNERWRQRFSNYKKALAKLEEGVAKRNRTVGNDFIETENLDEILREGLIQRFEYTHELAWKVMKDYLEQVGGLKIIGSKDASREAFSANLIDEGELWMNMIRSRNLSSHTYDEAAVQLIFDDILKHYLPALIAFRDKMESLR